MSETPPDTVHHLIPEGQILANPQPLGASLAELMSTLVTPERMAGALDGVMQRQAVLYQKSAGPEGLTPAENRELLDIMTTMQSLVGLDEKYGNQTE